MFDETVVMWGGEFGRDHNHPTGWLAEASRPVTFTAKPMNSAATLWIKSSTFTTCTPPCSTACGINHKKLTIPYEGREVSLLDSPVSGADITTELLA